MSENKKDNKMEEGDTMNIAINKPCESTIVLKGMTRAFINDLVSHGILNSKDCTKISKEVSSSTMEQMKKMCEDDNK